MLIFHLVDVYNPLRFLEILKVKVSMKKGLVIGLVAAVAVIGLIIFLAKHPPPAHAPAAGTETAEQLAAPAPEATPAAETATMQTPPAEQAAPAAASDVQPALEDRVLGRDDAPVTVIEYASLTCPHCAHFATDILPEVKAKLIDTGKMRLIFRDFPLDQMAMKAAKMARCAPHDNYFNLIEVIFKNRDRWMTSKEPENALMQLGALAGMDDSYMKKCIADPEIENAILHNVSEAQSKFFIKSTPMFVFNYGAETLSGAQDESKFEEIVNRLSAGKQE